MATVKDPDLAYTYFGWWLNKPKENDDPHDVEVFAGASDEEAMAAEVTALMEGTAKYSGPAAGKYVTKTFKAGVQTEAGVGHFTATTNLTARFLDADADDMGNISGTVTSFTLDDVTAVPWKVTLESAELTAAAFAGTTEVDFGGGITTTPDDVTEDTEHAGMWGGSFYDLAADADPDETPNTVIGTFSAATDDENANVIRAFGAKKQ